MDGRCVVPSAFDFVSSIARRSARRQGRARK
jgi:hypothetical protein